MKGLLSLCLLASLSLSIGCQKKVEESDLAVDPVEAAIESGVTMISGMPDEQQGTSYAFNSKPQVPSIWKTLLGETAFAETCTRAFYSSCTSGVRAATYNQCDIMGTAATLYGNVTLTYSDTACSMASTGNTVIRTYSAEIKGPRGGQINHTSDSRADYRGTSYGGGGKLSKTAGGWDIEVLGRNSQLSFRGRSIFDVSVRTLAPISVTGSLARASRVVTGGQLEVNHNLSQFTAVFTPTNLQWSNACCHPISGSLAVTYSGSKTGSATVTFGSCGTASVNHGGQVSSIQLSYCE